MAPNRIAPFVGILIVVWFFGWFIPGLSCNDWQERGYFDKSDCREAERDMRSDYSN